MKLINPNSNKFLLAVALCAVLLASCNKEPRRIDINDGNENPSERRLVIEMTHRYSNVADSLLPSVEISLFETEDDILFDRYTRRDTTDSNGMLIFQQMNSGKFIVVLQHQTLGTKRQQVNITNETVVSYENWYY